MEKIMLTISSNTFNAPSLNTPLSSIVSPLLCRKEAARYLGIATQTLAQWACNRRVPIQFVKIGRKAMYKKADLDDLIEANLIHAFDQVTADES
ncbi:helix-turn-helix domain-containing protein [Undibacterium sp. SXout7W]|uniref:helix-turn-helix domain-containing protein n=1 Tax=Undibacterium sp. SXout7W TaxID=3413049 RepID=UPI003BF19F77